MDLEGWTFSHHALQRAVDMCVPAEELRETLANPKATPWESDKYPGYEMRSNYRIALCCDMQRKYVITVLWFRYGREARFTRSVEDDMKRIRDANHGEAHH